MTSSVKPEPRKCRRCPTMVEAVQFPSWRGAVSWIAPDVCEPCDILERREEVQAENNARMKRVIAESGMGPLHLDMTWGTFQSPRPEISKAMQDCLDGKRGLMLIGGPGVGKTHAACAVLNRWIEMGHSGVIANVPNLMRGIREGMFGKGKVSLTVGDAEMLVLDDIGVEKASDFAIESIYTLLENWTVAKKRRLIVTSNLSLGELTDRIGERCVSRIIGICEIINATGEDRRKRRPS